MRKEPQIHVCIESNELPVDIYRIPIFYCEGYIRATLPNSEITFPGCCGCCSALRPRYKRLVDNIFPDNPEDGLVKSNMDKLTFYSLSSTEKLDRIGEYLYQKATKDINRKRYK